MTVRTIDACEPTGSMFAKLHRSTSGAAWYLKGIVQRIVKADRGSAVDNHMDILADHGQVLV
jgi:hypothetical protein